MGNISHTIGGDSNVVSFKSAARVPITSLKCNFTPIQEGSGDPNPENVRPISGWNSIEISCNGKTIPVIFPGVGKNLIDQSLLATQSGITFENDFYTGKRTNFFLSFSITSNIQYKENTQYTLSFVGKNSSSTGSSSLCFYYTDNTDSSITWSGTNETTASLTSDNNKTIKYVYFKFSGNNNVTAYIKNLQVEEGTTATAYEPFNNTIYGGYVDIAKGELVQEYYKTTLYNADDFSYSERNGFNRFRKNISDFGVMAAGNLYTYFNYLPIKSNQPWSAFINVSSGVDQARLDIYMPTSYNSTTALSNYLAEHPLEVCFKIEPIIYKLSPVQLKTLLDQNNIWSNTNDITEVSYVIHDSAMIRSTKKQIIGNEPHIETSSGMFANFNTDMIAPVKECKIYFNPIQEGTGDSSPNNIRNISGWSSVQFASIDNNYIPLIPSNPQDIYEDVKNNTGCRLAYLGNGKFKLLDSLDSDKMPQFSININPIICPSNINRLVAITSTKKEIGSWNFSWILFNDSINNIISGYLEYNPQVYVWTTTGDMSSAVGTIINKIRFVLYRTIPKDTEFVLYLVNKDNMIINTYNFPSNITPLYGGYIDLINGKIISEWGYDDLGNYDWWNGSDSGIAQIQSQPSNVKWWSNEYAANEVPYLLIDSIKVVSRDNFINIVQSNTSDIAMVNYRNVPYIASPNLINATEAQVKAYVTGKKFLYKLNTPIEYSMTPQQIKTIKGINNIWSNSNGSIEVKYWTH